MKQISAFCVWTSVTVLLVGTVMLVTLPVLPVPSPADLLPNVTGTIGAVSPQYNKTESWKALHFCKAAYCSESRLTTWTCGDACTTASPNFDVFNVYSNDTTSNQGYSGLDHDAQRIVVAFRGTINTANWIENLDFWSTPYPDPDCGQGCTVHRGFYRAYTSLQSKLYADVLAMHERYPSYSLYFTGHSLGGAMALLAAVDFSTLKLPRQAKDGMTGVDVKPLHLVPVELYTFGEPRVGNLFFTKWSTSVLANNRQFRVTHAKDPTPHLPPLSWGYLHAPQELWYPANDDTVVVCQDSSIAEDPLCSDSTFAVVLADHLLYLGTCTQCECTGAEMAEIQSYKMPPRVAAILARDHAMNGTTSQDCHEGTC